MKNFLLSSCGLVLLIACQNKAPNETDVPEIAVKDIAVKDMAEQEGGVAAGLPNVKLEPGLSPAAIKVPLDGMITVSPEPLISERSACIMPLRVSNGTESEVAVSMFNFKVTGPGKADTANMFAQPTPSGQARIARIILIGQSCEAFDTVTISEYLCVSGDEPCPANIGFENSDEVKLIGPN